MSMRTGIWLAAFFATSLTAAGGEPSREMRMCAAWDAHVATLLEVAGHSGDMSGDEIFKVWLLQLEARELCAKRLYRSAFDIYAKLDLD